MTSVHVIQLGLQITSVRGKSSVAGCQVHTYLMWLCQVHRVFFWQWLGHSQTEDNKVLANRLVVVRVEVIESQLLNKPDSSINTY